MLKLDFSGTAEPQWVDAIPGVRLRVRRIDTPVLTLAASMVLEDENRSYRVTVEAAKIAITEWEGIGDQDGNAVPATPGAVEVVLRDVPAVYAAFYSLCYFPAFSAHLELEAEKNG